MLYEVITANFGASDDDAIVHMSGAGSADSILAWRDRDGTVIQTVAEPAGYWEPRLSHDGTRLALAVGMDVADIWIYDLSSDRRTRFTFDPADDRGPLS